MLEQLRIPIDRDFDSSTARPDGFEADSLQYGTYEESSNGAMIATNAVSASEAALILAGPRRVASPGHAQLPVPARLTISRIADIVIAGTLCVVLLPVIAAIALCLTVFDRGPVFFAHRRIGRGGHAFGCLKFRTMCVDADQRLARLLADDEAMRREWSSTQKLLSDPRVTGIGRFLRNTSLDELPQLINVLRGEMSIVGPRPIVQDELGRYGRYAGLYTTVRPGLTGLWQVTRNSNTTYRRRVATDVYYVRNRTLALDFRILLATLPAVLLGNG